MDSALPLMTYKPLDSLVEAERNPKEHDLESIRASIRRWGFILPLVENASTGRLVAGHGRREALLGMYEAREPAPARIRVINGRWHVPVITGVHFASEAEAEAYLVADNKLVETGGWKSDELREMLRGQLETGVPVIGWSTADLQQLLVSAAGPGDAPQAPEPLPDAGPDDGAMLKQLILYYGADEFELVVARLQGVMEEAGLDSHTAVLMHLLGEHEQDRSDPDAA